MGSSLFGPSSTSSLNIAPSNDASSILTARKKSRDYENSIYSYNQNDMLGAEEIKASIGERKKSGSSSNSKGKEREKSEGSIYFLTDESRQDKSLECRLHLLDDRQRANICTVDQNFNSMDGIINPEYRNGQRTRTSFSQVRALVLFSDAYTDNAFSKEQWHRVQITMQNIGLHPIAGQCNLQMKY